MRWLAILNIGDNSFSFEVEAEDKNEAAIKGLNEALSKLEINVKKILDA